MRKAENYFSVNQLTDNESQKVRRKFFIVDMKFLTDYIPYVEWPVEFTDEFEKWWDSLDEEEQVSVDSVVGALKKWVPCCRIPIVRQFATRDTVICGNSGFSTAAIRTGFSTLSILDGLLSCSLGARRAGTMNVGTASILLSPTDCMTTTSTP